MSGPIARRCATLFLAIALGVSVTGAAPARAQTAAYAVRLVSQPVWARSGDKLNLKLQILNHGDSRLKGFRLIVGLHDAVHTRSALHESFGSIATSAPLSLPSDFSTSIAPGSSATVTLDDPLNQFASVLSEADQGGVFPMTIALAPRGGTEVLAQLTTDLLYFPTPPDVPLNFVLNVPVNAPAARGPEGAFGPIGDQWPLEDGLSPNGWLTTLENGMEKAGRRFHAGLAPTPRLLEELADISNGYRRTSSAGTTQTVGNSDATRAATAALNRLSDLAAGGSQLLLAPYSFPDLPTLDERLGTAELLKQLTVGSQKTRAALGVAPGTQWLFAPAGRVDAATLTDLRLGQYGAHMAWSEDSLEQPDDPSTAGCPNGSPTFTCPVAIDAPQGKSMGYATDGGIEERFAALAQGGQTRLDLQRLFAETALIWAELPGTEGRIVQATVPSLWHPTPTIANRLFIGLAHAPWLRMRTPASGLAHSVAPVTRHLVQDLGPLHDDPGTSYFDAVAGAASEVSSFDQIGPPAPLLDRLSDNVLVAQSRLWWGDAGAEARGRSFAEESANTARAELDKIDIGGVPEITMTSRSEDVPLVVFNDTGYPVNVLIHLSAQSLGLDRTIAERVAARTQQISVRITAKNSGIDPLQVVLETPDGRVIQTKTIRIRSTNFNEVALAITLGAGIFLLLFYMMRGVRKRRSAGTEPDPDPQTA